MKTFTTYAEKKAKQFFNLLQNYTKGIRFTAMLMLMLMLMGVSNAWAYTIGGTTIYADNYGTNWESIMIHMWSGDWNTQWKFTNISGTDYWYHTSTSAYGYAGYLWAEENWGSQTANIEADGAQSNWYTKCYSLKEGTWVTPGLKNVTYTKNTTTTLAGSGTNSNPYIVAPGTKITVKLSGDLIDSNCSKSYKFGTSSATTTQTNTLASSAVAGTSYSKEGFTGSTRGSYSSRYASAGTLYFNTAYNISASVSGGNGSVAITSGGDYVYTDNTSFTIKATPNTGYEVDTWTVTGGTKSGSGNTITVTASNTSNVTVVVTFKPIQYTVTYGIYNSTGGSIKLNSGSAVTSSSSSSIDHGTNITFTATPATGYQIEGWYSNAACTSSLNNGTNTTYTISSLTAAAIVYVKFEPIPETKYDVTISSAGNGSVDPSGTQQVGESGIDITATAANNYQFSHWTTTGGAIVANANSANTTVTATNSGSVTAHFKEIIRTITVTCNANHGTVSPSSTTAGVVTASGTITATPNAGYEFTNWTASSGITLADANSATTTITQATANGTVTANFSEIKHTVQVGIVADQKSWGSVSPASVSVGQHTASNEITATAQTSVGYVFDHWEISDGITITSGDANNATIKIKATKDGSLTAHFRGENRMQDVYLIGTMNNWKKSDAEWRFYKLPGESGNTVTLTKTINKSDYHDAGYEFGINIYHSDWDDKYWKNSSSEDTKMTAHNCTGWKFGTKE